MRYTGPKWRINRRENAQVLGSNDKWKKRPGNPGMHPFSKGRPTDYAVQFREKQKVKRMFGMSEKQFKRFYEMAIHSSENTGTKLVQLLSQRIDNVIYTLGLAVTRAQARQFVNHGLVTLNGKKHDIPSYITQVGDEIKLKEKITSLDMHKVILQKTKAVKVPEWLTSLENGGRVVSVPAREELDGSIRERLIVELYSR